MAKPHAIGDVLGELISRRGYARIEAGEACAAAWRSAAGEPLAALTRAGGVRRGVLEVLVANSTLVQELTYRKAVLLAQLQRDLPQEKIKEIRFKVGAVK